MQDLLGLYQNCWVAPWGVEGPKKIDHVRAHANKARAAAGGPNMRGNQRGGDYHGGGGGLDLCGEPSPRYAKGEHFPHSSLLPIRLPRPTHPPTNLSVTFCFPA